MPLSNTSCGRLSTLAVAWLAFQATGTLAMPHAGLIRRQHTHYTVRTVTVSAPVVVVTAMATTTIQPYATDSFSPKENLPDTFDSSAPAPTYRKPSPSDSTPSSKSRTASPLTSLSASSTASADTDAASKSVPSSFGSSASAQGYASSASVSTTASSSSSSPTSSSAGGGGKRGLAYNDASLTHPFVGSDSKVGWAYNWASSGSGVTSGLEYVPMMWGLNKPDQVSAWPAAASSAIAAGAKNLLAFNEPDNAGQANIDPKTAAAGYKAHIAPFSSQARLGAPAVTNSGSPSQGLSWLTAFLAACTDCPIDFVPIHWYDVAANVDAFKQHVEAAHTAAGGRKLWITEFGATGSLAEQQKFLEQVMPWLDSQDYVERYAYFADFENVMVNGGKCTDLGEAFRSG